MNARPPPLPSFYYVQNFAAAIECLVRRDHDLFDKAQATFVAAFSRRPLPEQALIVRMALRRGPYYRGSSLRYPELDDPAPHLAALQQAGWVTDDPVVDAAVLIAALPVTWLAEGFRLRRMRTLSKSRMCLQAQEMYPEQLPLSCTHFRLTDGLYEFLHYQTCRSLCALYFGNHHQDWSEYVVTDLGIRRYERVQLDTASRPFASRAEVDLFQDLYRCQELLDSQSALAALARLPPAVAGCDWLVERHRHLSLRIARQLEREGETGSALEVYERVSSPESEQRRRIVSRRLGSGAAARPRFDHRAVPHFEIELHRDCNARIEYHVAEELRRQAPDSEVIYAENRLINSLFGLIFWHVIFAPVRGAFFHPFHAAPADLYSPQFCIRRHVAIDAALGLLEGPDYVNIIRECFHAKRGLLNPFVAWGWLRAAVMEGALRCIPAVDLRRIFEWMLADLERNTTGFPDLLQMWPAERRYRLVEVKLGADRLQLNQRRFLRHAQEQGIPVSVCYASRPAPEQRSSRAHSPAKRAGQSLELFPDAQDHPAPSY